MVWLVINSSRPKWPPASSRAAAPLRCRAAGDAGDAGAGAGADTCGLLLHEMRSDLPSFRPGSWSRRGERCGETEKTDGVEEETKAEGESGDD